MGAVERVQDLEEEIPTLILEIQLPALQLLLNHISSQNLSFLTYKMEI